MTRLSTHSFPCSGVECIALRALVWNRPSHKPSTPPSSPRYRFPCCLSRVVRQDWDGTVRPVELIVVSTPWNSAKSPFICPWADCRLNPLETQLSPPSSVPFAGLTSFDAIPLSSAYRYIPFLHRGLIHCELCARAQQEEPALHANHHVDGRIWNYLTLFNYCTVPFINCVMSVILCSLIFILLL